MQNAYVLVDDATGVVLQLGNFHISAPPSASPAGATWILLDAPFETGHGTGYDPTYGTIQNAEGFDIPFRFAPRWRGPVRLSANDFAFPQVGERYFGEDGQIWRNNTGRNPYPPESKVGWDRPNDPGRSSLGLEDWNRNTDYVLGVRVEWGAETTRIWECIQPHTSRNAHSIDDADGQLDPTYWEEVRYG